MRGFYHDIYILQKEGKHIRINEAEAYWRVYNGSARFVDIFSDISCLNGFYIISYGSYNSRVIPTRDNYSNGFTDRAKIFNRDKNHSIKLVYKARESIGSGYVRPTGATFTRERHGDLPWESLLMYCIVKPEYSIHLQGSTPARRAEGYFERDLQRGYCQARYANVDADAIAKTYATAEADFYTMLKHNEVVDIASVVKSLSFIVTLLDGVDRGKVKDVLQQAQIQLCRLDFSSLHYYAITACNPAVDKALQKFNRKIQAADLEGKTEAKSIIAKFGRDNIIASYHAALKALVNIVTGKIDVCKYGLEGAHIIDAVNTESTADTDTATVDAESTADTDTATVDTESSVDTDTATVDTESSVDAASTDNDSAEKTALIGGLVNVINQIKTSKQKEEYIQTMQYHLTPQYDFALQLDNDIQSVQKGITEVKRFLTYYKDAVKSMSKGETTVDNAIRMRGYVVSSINNLFINTVTSAVNPPVYTDQTTQLAAPAFDAVDAAIQAQSVAIKHSIDAAMKKATAELDSISLIASVDFDIQAASVDSIPDAAIADTAIADAFNSMRAEIADIDAVDAARVAIKQEIDSLPAITPWSGPTVIDKNSIKFSIVDAESIDTNVNAADAYVNTACGIIVEEANTLDVAEVKEVITSRIDTIFHAAVNLINDTVTARIKDAVNVIDRVVSFVKKPTAESTAEEVNAAIKQAIADRGFDTSKLIVASPTEAFKKHSDPSVDTREGDAAIINEATDDIIDATDDIVDAVDVIKDAVDDITEVVNGFDISSVKVKIVNAANYIFNALFTKSIGKGNAPTNAHRRTTLCEEEIIDPDDCNTIKDSVIEIINNRINVFADYMRLFGNNADTNEAALVYSAEAFVADNVFIGAGVDTITTTLVYATFIADSTHETPEPPQFNRRRMPLRMRYRHFKNANSNSADTNADTATEAADAESNADTDTATADTDTATVDTDTATVDTVDTESTAEAVDAESTAATVNTESTADTDTAVVEPIADSDSDTLLLNAVVDLDELRGALSFIKSAKGNVKSSYVSFEAPSVSSLSIYSNVDDFITKIVLKKACVFNAGFVRISFDQLEKALKNFKGSLFKGSLVEFAVRTANIEYFNDKKKETYTGYVFEITQTINAKKKLQRQLFNPIIDPPDHASFDSDIDAEITIQHRTFTNAFDKILHVLSTSLTDNFSRRFCKLRVENDHLYLIAGDDTEAVVVNIENKSGWAFSTKTNCEVFLHINLIKRALKAAKDGAKDDNYSEVNIKASSTRQWTRIDRDNVSFIHKYCYEGEGMSFERYYPEIETLLQKANDDARVVQCFTETKELLDAISHLTLSSMKNPELLIGSGNGGLKLTLHCEKTGLTGITDILGHVEDCNGRKLITTSNFIVDNVNGFINMLKKINVSSLYVVLELSKIDTRHVLKIRTADSDEFTGFLPARLCRDQNQTPDDKGRTTSVKSTIDDTDDAEARNASFAEAYVNADAFDAMIAS